MKYAIISDIHSNIEALQAVIDDAKPQVDQFVCLGDIVGNKASPNECLNLVREWCEVIIVGNHDQATAGTRAYDDFNAYAQAAIDWTKTQLDTEAMTFLANLALTTVFGDHYLATHGSPRHTDEYLLHPQRIQQNFAYLIKKMPRIRHQPVCPLRSGRRRSEVLWQVAPSRRSKRVGRYL
jgi:predicted phosphodiesterase